MKLYRTTQGIFIEKEGAFTLLPETHWDALFSTDNLYAWLSHISQDGIITHIDPTTILAPVVSQEIWAAGVTYYMSRSARMEESKDNGGGSFYDRVYNAERPELFFKSVGARVVGPGNSVKIRSDANWSVPEPELTLVLNRAAQIIGYTIGNDMSSRDIEGENPLYLPQAKVYDSSCAIGPCILLTEEPLPIDTSIKMEILHNDAPKFVGSTTLAMLKRDPKNLTEFLFREMSFPDGVLLMTGTGIVPNDNFTLHHGDKIRISIDGIGVLENFVA